jgi:hypothetical protein
MPQNRRPETYGIKSHDAIVAIREIIRRSFLTFKALPDPQASFRYQGQSWIEDVMDDYGKEYTYIDYRPTAYEIDQATDTLSPWMRYLTEVEGAESVRRLQAWSYGVSTKAQAKREGCSETTLMNRIDRSVAKIIAKFFGLNCRIERVEEPWKETHFALCWRDEEWAMKAGVEQCAKIQTVYVYGKGLMRNGRRWDDGRRKAEKLPGTR